MMELPDFSRQLLQQLWALRMEAAFCDCTILVGDRPHRAHKLVLAASSLLFRSLLQSSDTISIDTALVSSQEFGALLEMIYTGRLPLGKHNASRMVAAADSLQMYDVAVGFRKVLATLVGHTAPAGETTSAASRGSPDRPAPEEVETPAALEDSSCHGNQQDAEEPAAKKARQEPSAASGDEEAGATEGASRPATELLHRSSQVVALLSDVPSVLELLSQAAQSGLDERDRQVVSQCYQDSDPGSVLQKLVGRLRDGVISEDSFTQLLQAVRRTAPLTFPAPLRSLLEDQEGTPPPAGACPEQQQQEEEEEEEEEESPEEQQAEEPAVSGSTEEEEEAPAAADSSPSASKRYACQWCNKRFDFQCRLLVHAKRCSQSQEGELQCPQCPQKLPSQRALQRHRGKAHRNTARLKKRVACDLCGRSFAQPSGLVYHKQVEHLDVKPFACQECGATFGANSSLKNHMRLHTGEKPYRCQHCDMSFSVAAALAYHTKKKHSEGKMYACQYCKAVFAQSIELTRHVRTHTGDRPYVCRECGKGYSQASGLTVHLQTFHNLSEPHDCKKCCLSFPTLEQHQQHLQELHPKDFHKCNTCSKVFQSAALLDKHQATHAGSKPFSCTLCNKSYQQLSGLWYHNRTTHPEVFASHTRQLRTLLQCQLCFKFFPDDATLSAHQASEHQASEPAAGSCLYSELSGSEAAQEHVCSQPEGQAADSTSCSLCSLICASQLQLQEHLLSCHMELEPEPGAQGVTSTTYTVISAGVKEEGAEPSVLCEEKSQQVLVSLSSGIESSSSAELVEMKIDELIDGSVTFICSQDKMSPPDP